jgi:hypothetical protein
MAVVIFHMCSFSPALLNRQNNGCIDPNPASNITDRLNIALNSSGPGFILQLCANAQYMIQRPILFAAPNQEISTQGYPTDYSRATLVVNGPVSNGKGHTTAVDGTCSNCNGVKLRNIQVRPSHFVSVCGFSHLYSDRWGPCRRTSNCWRGKYRDGWLEFGPVD